MEQCRSTPVAWIGEEHLGYAVNVAFSAENTNVIMSWLSSLQKVASEGIYAMTPDSLHITVLDWVSPLFDYGRTNKRALYEELRPVYDPVFRRLTEAMEPFNIHFTELRVTPATVILLGHDAGQLQALRQSFIENVTLPDGAKPPPDIIHTSLARFIAPQIELSPVAAYAVYHPIDLTQRVDEFRLVESRREPMQDFSVIDTYKLASSKERDETIVSVE